MLLAFSSVMAGAGALSARVTWTTGDAVGLALFVVIAITLALRSTRTGVAGKWGTGQRILLLAFLVRGLFAIALRLHPLPLIYRTDAGMYDDEAWTIAEAWLAEADPRLPSVSFNVAAYESLSAAVYLLVGRSVLSMQVLGALAGALSVYYGVRVARELMGEGRAAVVGFLLTLWPSHVLWSSQNIRDPWVFLFVSMTLWWTIRWLEHSRPLDWMRAASCLILAGVFRLSTTLALGAAVLAVSAYWAWRRIRWRRRPRFVVAVFGGLVVLGWTLFGLGPPSDIAFGAPWSPEGLSRIRQQLATGGAAFYPDLTFTSWGDVLAFVPIGLAHVLFAPFPWDATNGPQLASVLENVALCGLLAAGLLGPRRLTVVGYYQYAFIALFLVIGLAGLAVIEGNVGTAYRHKIQFLPSMLLLVGAGWPIPRDAGQPRAEPAAQ
jgi:hypothetical protein